MCVCVGVPSRNDFLRNNGAIQAKPPTTKRYTQVLNQINAKVSQILTKEEHIESQCVTPQKYSRIFIIILLYILGIN